jgi:hypothetical protein
MPDVGALEAYTGAIEARPGAVEAQPGAEEANYEALKVHKIEIFFGFDFEICIISLLLMSKY